METIKLGTFTDGVSNGDGDAFYSLMAKTRGIVGEAVPADQFDNLNDAIADIGANIATVVISGVVELTASLAIPANVAIKINRGGLINAGNYTLTINGPLHAGLYKVFGTGTFLFGKGTIQHCHPQWWGASSDGTNGAATAAAIQAAHDSGAKVFFVPGQYLIASTIYYKSNACFEGAGRCGSGWIDGGSTVLGGGVALIAASGITMFQTYGTTGTNPTGMVYQANFRNLSFYVTGKGAGTGTAANYLSGAVGIDVTGSESIRIKGVDFHNFDKAIYARTCNFGSGAGSQYTARFFLDDFTAQECRSIVYLSDKLYAAILPHADITITNGTYTRFCGTSAGSQFYISGCDGFTMSDITSFPSFGHGASFLNSVNIRLSGLSMFEGEANNLNFSGCTLVSGAALVLMRAGWTNASSANSIGITNCTNVTLHADCERPRGSNVNIVGSRDISLHGTFVGAFYGLRAGVSGQAFYIDATSHNVGIFGTVEGTITDTYETDALQHAINAASGSYGIGGHIASDVPVNNAPNVVVIGPSGVTSSPFGTVKSVAVNTANGFKGTVDNNTSTPAINIRANVTGILKSDAAGVVTAAVAGTDYGAGTVTNVSGAGCINVSNGTTTPTVSITAASGSTNGYMSSGDYTFLQSRGNGTVTTVSGSGCISVANGTTTPVVSITKATASVNGYLSASDWSTFNSKVSSASPTLTGTVTISDQIAFTPKTAAVASAVDVSGASLIVLTSGSGTINYFNNYVTNQEFRILNATGSTVTVSNAGGNWSQFTLAAGASATIINYGSGLYKVD